MATGALLRIKKSLGIASKTFAKLNFYKWLLLYLRIDLMPQQHVVDRYMETIAHMGLATTNKDWIILFLHKQRWKQF